MMTVARQSYRTIFIRELSKLKLAGINTVFQHDEAPNQFAHNVRQFLKISQTDGFGGDGPAARSVRSSRSVSLRHFYFYGHVFKALKTL